MKNRLHKIYVSPSFVCFSSRRRPVTASILYRQKSRIDTKYYIKYQYTIHILLRINPQFHDI